MRFLLKLMVLFLLAAFVLPFITLGPDGSPLLHWSSITRNLNIPQTPDFSGMIESVNNQLPNFSDPKTHEDRNTTYQWKDENGTWNFSNNKPDNAINAETLDDRPMNVMPNSLSKHDTPLPNPDHASRSEQQSKSLEKIDTLSTKGLAFPNSDPRQIQKLMDQARDIERIGNERLERMDQMTR
jgi:hypothetical protein